MTARLLALLKDQRSIDGISATLGMLFTLAIYAYLDREPVKSPLAEPCIAIPYAPFERGAQCYRHPPFARERTEKTR